MGQRGGQGSQLGLRVGLASVLSLTRHSLDLRLARDLQLGREAREPQSPSMEGVGSFPVGQSGEPALGVLQLRTPALPWVGRGPPLQEGPGCPCTVGAAFPAWGGATGGIQAPG